MTKLIVAFGNYANASKKGYSSSVEFKSKEHGAEQSTAFIGPRCWVPRVLQIAASRKYSCSQGRTSSFDNLRPEKDRTIQAWINVKVKFTLEQATKDQRGSRGIALLFL
jgi:hypothetical protein